jgi:hypothetical protein
MATNKSPQLIILTTENQREQLKAYAQANNLAMGEVVRQLIDQLLAGEIALGTPGATKISEPVSNISLEPIEKRLLDIEKQLLSLEPIEKRLADIEQAMASKEPETVVESQESVIKVEDIEADIEIGIEKPTYLSWAQFHKHIGVPVPSGKSRSRFNGDAAVTMAKGVFCINPPKGGISRFIARS